MKTYWQLNSFMKRLHNFVVYLTCAFVSIFNPEAVDRALYVTLKRQFEEDVKNGRG